MALDQVVEYPRTWPGRSPKKASVTSSASRRPGAGWAMDQRRIGALVRFAEALQGEVRGAPSTRPNGRDRKERIHAALEENLLSG